MDHEDGGPTVHDRDSFTDEDVSRVEYNAAGSDWPCIDDLDDVPEPVLFVARDEEAA